MKRIGEIKNVSVDWRWVGVGTCFFIVMHLLPTYILFELRVITTLFGAIFSVWVFAGMAFISFFIGWKSKGVTIIEAGLAAFIYGIVLMLAINQEWGVGPVFPLVIKPLGWFFAVVVIATVSAWFGELVQSIKAQGKIEDLE
ncbi:MAG TPA: hypothetical protein VMG34_00940 [Bacteroidota bacterium]|nr:hypothetical protein [Bacteroidota bacterium]